MAGDGRVLTRAVHHQIHAPVAPHFAERHAELVAQGGRDLGRHPPLQDSEAASAGREQCRCSGGLVIGVTGDASCFEHHKDRGAVEHGLHVVGQFLLRHLGEVTVGIRQLVEPTDTQCGARRPEFDRSPLGQIRRRSQRAGLATREAQLVDVYAVRGELVDHRAEPERLIVGMRHHHQCMPVTEVNVIQQIVRHGLHRRVHRGSGTRGLLRARESSQSMFLLRHTISLTRRRSVALGLRSLR